MTPFESVGCAECFEGGMPEDNGGASYAPQYENEDLRRVRRDMNELEAEIEGWDRPLSFDDPEVPAFPVDALPEWLALFVEAEAMATQTPKDLTAMLSLAACATALQGRFRVHVTGRWLEPLNLYVAVVLDPASRKSSVYSCVVAPLEEWEREEQRRLGPEIASAQAHRRTIEAALKAAEKRAAKAVLTSKERSLEVESLARELNDYVVPTPPQLILDDVTPEKLAAALAEQGGRIAIWSAEGGGPFSMMRGRYSKNGLPNFDVFLKAHAGDMLRVHRIGREPDQVTNPALTMGLTVQPEVLRGLADEPEFRLRGLLGRFLFSIPKNTVGYRRAVAPAVPQDIYDEYRANVLALLSLPGEGTVVEMEPKAERAVLEYQAALEPGMRPGGEMYHYRDWAGKLGGVCARLATILEAAEAVSGSKTDGQNGHYGQNGSSVNCVNSVPISLKTHYRSVILSMKICDYLCGHAKVAYGRVGANRDNELATYVLAMVKGRGWAEASKRDIHRICQGRVQRTEELDTAVQILSSYHWIRLKEKQPPSGGGAGRRPSPVYEFTPYLYTDPKNLDTIDRIENTNTNTELGDKTPDPVTHSVMTESPNALDDCPI